MRECFDVLCNITRTYTNEISSVIVFRFNQILVINERKKHKFSVNKFNRTYPQTYYKQFFSHQLMIQSLNSHYWLTSHCLIALQWSHGCTTTRTASTCTVTPFPRSHNEPVCTPRRWRCVSSNTGKGSPTVTNVGPITVHGTSATANVSTAESERTQSRPVARPMASAIVGRFSVGSRRNAESYTTAGVIDAIQFRVTVTRHTGEKFCTIQSVSDTAASFTIVTKSIEQLACGDDDAGCVCVYDVGIENGIKWEGNKKCKYFVAVTDYLYWHIAL